MSQSPFFPSYFTYYLVSCRQFKNFLPEFIEFPYVISTKKKGMCVQKNWLIIQEKKSFRVCWKKNDVEKKTRKQES